MSGRDENKAKEVKIVAKSRFLLKYTLLYALCLTISLGLCFVLIALTFFEGELSAWHLAVCAAIIVLAVVIGFFYARRRYERVGQDGQDGENG